MGPAINERSVLLRPVSLWVEYQVLLARRHGVNDESMAADTLDLTGRYDLGRNPVTGPRKPSAITADGHFLGDLTASGRNSFQYGRSVPMNLGL